ncbi:MAG: dienelactone hydrolase family protein [Capsulimonadales bacterium]|nr:dienelactone hydrolase family protein [Capsulimonadales bacterium]
MRNVSEKTKGGYLSVPTSGGGPGLIVLPSWWGLNAFFTGLCDRFAEAGFVALAPDPYDGAVAVTIEEAEKLKDSLNEEATLGQILAAADHLRGHPAVEGDYLGVVGFSLGAHFALQFSASRPDDVAAVVLFYGLGETDFTAVRAAFLGHFAENDPWEPMEHVRWLEGQLRAAGREVTFHIYPGVGHWFPEADRPDAFDPDAARLAWDRTVAFLNDRLKSADRAG